MEGMMEDGARPSLEAALTDTEAAANKALNAAQAVVTAIKRYRTAAQTGNLRDLARTADQVDNAEQWLRQEFANMQESWDFEDEAYLSSGDFSREIRERGRAAGLAIYEQDERLLSFPVLIRILPGDRSIQIDKTRERRLRPSVLIAHLRALQQRQPRFRPETFLTALHKAYRQLGGEKEAKEGQTAGTVIPLRQIYEVLTLLPGSARDYSQAEFARDIYLLDRSEHVTTRDGWTVSFPASTGTKTAGGSIRTVTQSGDEKKYYGIAFDRSD